MSTTSPLLQRIEDATNADFSTGERTVEVIGALDGPSDAVVFLSGRVVVAADVDEGWVHDQLASQRGPHPEDRSSGLGRFVTAMVERLERPSSYISVLATAPRRAAMVRGTLTPSGVPDRGWAAYRSDVTSYRFDSQGAVGTIDIGHGPGGRWDTFVRVDDDAAGSDGDSRQLLAAALSLVSRGENLYCSAPLHDIRALRTMLAGGFRPVGTEVLFLTRPQRGGHRAATPSPARRTGQSSPDAGTPSPSSESPSLLSRLLRRR